MEDDALYFAGYTLLDRCSNERGLLCAAIKNLLGDRCIGPRRILDVGSGSGRLFRAASGNKVISYLEFVEPSALQYELSYSEAVNSAKKFLGHNAKVCDVLGILGENYDVIILSHVLYHIPRTDWLALIDRLMAKRSKGGVVIVILWNSKSEAYKLANGVVGSKNFVLSEGFYKHLSEHIGRSELDWRIDATSIQPRIKLHTRKSYEVLWQFLTKCSIESGDSLDYPGPEAIETILDIRNDQDVYCIS